MDVSSNASAVLEELDMSLPALDVYLINGAARLDEFESVGILCTTHNEIEGHNTTHTHTQRQLPDPVIMTCHVGLIMLAPHLCQNFGGLRGRLGWETSGSDRLTVQPRIRVANATEKP